MKEILKKVGKFILYSIAAIIVISIAADEFYVSKDEIEQMEQERQEFTDGYIKKDYSRIDNINDMVIKKVSELRSPDTPTL